ncbi:MAG: GNAT family N-acetyltransferase [Pseudomonadota bacterium]
MPLSHRPATEQDIARLCTFPQNPDELFFFFPKAHDPLTAEQLRAAMAQRSDSTVVERDSEVLGFANFYRWENDGRCSIGNVIVAPSARGQGVARYLIEQMIGIARARHKAREIGISCFNQNVAGLLLYPSLGFEPYAIEERQAPQGQRVALIHMRLALEA